MIMVNDSWFWRAWKNEKKNYDNFRYEIPNRWEFEQSCSLGLLCEWLVLQSDEFDEGFQGQKRGVVLMKRNIQEAKGLRSDVFKWWTLVEEISNL